MPFGSVSDNCAKCPPKGNEIIREGRSEEARVATNYQSVFGLEMIMKSDGG